LTGENNFQDIITDVATKVSSLAQKMTTDQGSLLNGVAEELRVLANGTVRQFETQMVTRKPFNFYHWNSRFFCQKTLLVDLGNTITQVEASKALGALVLVGGRAARDRLPNEVSSVSGLFYLVI
jgi:hypothetical protein